MATPYDRTNFDTWTDDKICDLIILYHSHTNLWDRQHPDYRKHSAKFSSISKISQRLKVSDDEVKAKIAKLRAKFDQCWASHVTAPHRTVDWPFFKHLLFLTQGHRKPEEKFNVNGSENNKHMDLSASNVSLNASSLDAFPESPRDPIDRLYLAMASLIKHFPRIILAELNAKIMLLISEMEMKLANQDDGQIGVASTSKRRRSSASSTSNRRHSSGASNGRHSNGPSPSDGRNSGTRNSGGASTSDGRNSSTRNSGGPSPSDGRNPGGRNSSGASTSDGRNSNAASTLTTNGGISGARNSSAAFGSSDANTNNNKTNSSSRSLFESN